MSGEAVKQAIANQLKNMEVSTGKKLEEWTAIVNDSGLEKHSELVNMLKSRYGLGHGNANMLVHHAKQSHAAAVDNDEDLVDAQYRGKEELKTWYDELIGTIRTFGKDIDISPKKAYVSLRRKKQFAILQPSTKSRLDIGLNIKNAETVNNLDVAGSWNTMCSHRLKIEKKEDINANVINWLRQAYEEAG